MGRSRESSIFVISAKVAVLLCHLTAICCAETTLGPQSLTLVVDTSGSMYTELRLILRGVHSLQYLPSAVISEYILVPFSDPEVGSVTRTTTPKALYRQMALMSPRNGGDCPEMALSGLLKAMDLTKPNSSILFFSDASAKDFELAGELIQSVRRKGVRLVMMLTGSCIEAGPDSNGVFERVAKATDGVVYRAARSGVSSLMAFVKMSMKRDIRRLQHPPADFKFVQELASQSDDEFAGNGGRYSSAPSAFLLHIQNGIALLCLMKF